ncbi:hypothetical protein BD410DRAFT_766433 [Rickenella mellea]|uniref:Endonuclease/exonuclease/phosphatase domain-containing protein n=1 Tax=Rickenella mellea TaxID=50990 RepID=A0A4Y7QCQ1_9AGAM|nr:hypothetical protein BD410DRAFT_766433 [Rickenella mellea]
MPLQRNSSSMSKREASPDASTENDTRSSKKAKVELKPANTQPTNKVLPTVIQIPKKPEGSIRIASWNVSGLAASQKKGFKFYVEAEDPDILILTETKVNGIPVDPNLTQRFPHRYWSISDKKGYAGTAILSKIKPLSVTTKLPGHPDDNVVKGRLVTLEFENYWLVGTYVVNAGQDLKTLDVKNEWNKHFEKYLRHLDSTKPVIWAGDLNVAPTAQDLTHAKKNWNKTAGYTEAETTAFARILDPSIQKVPWSTNGTDGSSEDAETIPDTMTAKFVDVWRNLHPDDNHYSYFSYRFNCREKGIGWRIDMFVLSERMVEKVQSCEIRSEIWGASDHCPVVLEISGAL